MAAGNNENQHKEGQVAMCLSGKKIVGWKYY